MDAELSDKISSLVGCIYFVLPVEDSFSDQNALCLFDFDKCLASSSISRDPSLIGEHTAELMSRAVHIGFACLVSNFGESMVPSAPVLDLIQHAKIVPNSTPPYFVVEYPSYNSNGSRVPLIFPTELAYSDFRCEVCIMKPINLPYLSTRSLDVSFNEFVNENLEQHDPLYCFFFSVKEHSTAIIQGRVSLQNPSSYGLIARFDLALSLRAGVITNSAGQIIGIHICDFTIKEGDRVDLSEPEIRKANNVAQVVIKDNTDVPASPIPGVKSSIGMPLLMLKQVQDEFACTDKHRKQHSQQSRIYLLSQARERLWFFKRRSSLMCSLTSLMVNCNDDIYGAPTSTQHLHVQQKHKRQRLWRVVANTMNMFQNDNSEYASDDTDS